MTWFKNKGFPTSKVEVQVKADSLSEPNIKSEQLIEKPLLITERTLKVLKNGSYKDCLKLGETLKKEGKLDEAFTALEEAIALHPNYSWSYNSLGKVLEKLGKLDKAAIAYRQAIKLKPKFPWYHYNLGQVLEKQGKLEEAKTIYRIAQELYPNLSLFQNINLTKK
ncbi:tetratricopeptide repeat protein [Okeania sp.]|uniref:tetratricopeptide repeat protein n=1 Tax=Okeania sp. TaxID=3100323 RepID=UPI002B4AAF4B|nr:tetratricopeptide repeat protein [Okeania sp.]MEB3341895.1 tetratricopeptide repeat protein [Okeania sp.]